MLTAVVRHVVQGIKVVAAAAKQAGVTRIVLLSSLLVTDRHRYLSVGRGHML
jgi:nucleoside-diphosphate-sugar epimerase